MESEFNVKYDIFMNVLDREIVIMFFFYLGTMLTIVYLMRALDGARYMIETEELLVKLVKTDPMRTGYYNDLSKFFTF